MIKVNENGFNVHEDEYTCIRAKMIKLLESFYETMDIHSIIITVLAETDNIDMSHVTTAHINSIKNSFATNRVEGDGRDMDRIFDWLNTLTVDNFNIPEHWKTLPRGFRTHSDIMKKYIYMHPFLIVTYTTLNNILKNIKASSRKKNMIEKRYQNDKSVYKKTAFDEGTLKKLWETTNT